MSTIDNRNEQMFPKLTPNEIDRLRRFGEVRHYAPGDLCPAARRPPREIFYSGRRLVLPPAALTNVKAGEDEVDTISGTPPAQFESVS
ncbi:MAG TPA: hypothetical protein VGH49_19975 [Xanthobacteraceae bacterium]